jgi:hypothetical protein
MPEENGSASSYWRIRMKDGEGQDFSADGWNRDEVGIWYGAWTADDFGDALKSCDPLKHLAQLPHQKVFGWEPSANFLSTARRFSEIPDGHWVVLYFGNKLCLARLRGKLRSGTRHPLNRSWGEVFKFRRIEAKKEFNLSRLPDVYRLIPSAGRGNVHQFNGQYRELVRLLADTENEQEVVAKVRSVPLAQALELLGDSGWESLCMGYLILEEGFVPTGLLLGRTLKDHDIVGRRFASGGHVLAQCKKTPYPVQVEPAFIEACEGLQADDGAFYFAFEGCTGEVPSGIEVLSRKDIEAWAKTERGKRYVDLFFGSA